MSTVNELFENIQDSSAERLKYFDDITNTLLQISPEPVTTLEEGKVILIPGVQVYSGRYINGFLANLISIKEEIKPLVGTIPELAHTVLMYMANLGLSLKRELSSGIIYEGKGSWNSETTNSILSELEYECRNSLYLQTCLTEIKKLFVTIEKIYEDVNAKNRMTRIKHVIDIKLYVTLDVFERGMVELIRELEEQL